MRGVLIGGRLLAFSVIRNALKSRADVLTFGLKKALFASVSGNGFGGGNMISLPTLNFPKYC